MTLRLIFAGSCIFTALIMLAGLYMISRQKDSIKRVTTRLVAAATVAVVVSALEMLLPYFRIMVISRSIFYFSMDCICYLMLKYTIEYTKQKRWIPIIDIVENVLILVDLIAITVGAFTNFEGVFSQVIYKEEAFILLAPAIPYYCHLLLCYILLGNAFLRLGIAIFKSSVLFKIKYVCMLATLLVIVIADGIFLSTHFVVDVSILFFAVAVILLIYFTFYFVPSRLRTRMQGIALSHMNDFVVIFDEEGKFIYLNRPLESIIMKNTEGLSDAITLNEFREIIKNHTFSENKISISVDNEVFYYETKSTELNDQAGKYIGIFYVLTDITDEQKLEREQFHLKNFDSLTGLYNREYFIEKTTDYLRENPSGEYLLVCTDIRHFKTLNDIFGARVGDQVLQSIAREIRHDDNHDRIYGRIGDDSFAVFLKKEGFDVESFAQKLKSTLQIPYLQYNIVNHIGVYEVEDSALAVAAMCDRAMMAISNAKNRMNNEIVYYDDNLRDLLTREQAILKDVDKAFNHGQFTIYLQPQINHRLHRIDSAEALVRWNHPEQGLVLPGQFVPVLEKHGLITRLDRYVWDMACRQVAIWREAGMDSLSISVNISTNDFNSLDLYEEFTNLIKKYEIEPRNIRLEITETTYATDIANQMATIEKLRKAGFIVEMDDFGSGYSSLNTLKDMPVDVLKLDMAFISGDDKFHRSEDILRMVVAMADVIGISVIAEGVETKEQADFLVNIGCDIIQGYYYAKPMPVHQYENLVREFNGKKYDDY